VRNLLLQHKGSSLLKSMAIPLVFIGLLGGVVTFLLYINVTNLLQHKFRYEFSQQIDDTFFRLEKKILINKEMLKSIALFVSSNSDVSWESFQDYTTPYLISRDYIQVLGWVPKVNASDRSVYEGNSSANGKNYIQIKEINFLEKIVRAKDRDVYYPVYFVEPHDSNVNLLGYDISSDIILSEILENAGNSGKLAGVKSMRIFQDLDSSFALFVFAPVYQGSSLLNTEKIRRKNLKGFVLGVFRMDSMINSILAELSNEDLQFKVFGQEDDTKWSFLFSNTSLVFPMDEHWKYSDFENRVDQNNQSIVKLANLANIKWSIVFEPSATFIAKHKSWLNVIVAWGGGILTLLSMMYAFLILLGKYKANLGIERLSEALNDIKEENDAQKKSKNKLEALFSKTTKKLELSNRDLEQYAYVASHDLQEPLRMVTSYTQLLADKYKGKLDSDADDFIQFALNGAYRMQRLINDLLSYARVGRKDKKLELIDCESVVNQAIDNLELKIKENKAVVNVGALPKIRGDETLIVRLFQNFIDNAIKFKKDGPPVIDISAHKHNDDYVFTVADNGIGIQDKHKDRVFNIFQRLHSMEEFEGSGIGLAVCKKIIDRHQGEIWVESEFGKGTRFLFTIPLRKESGKDIAD